MNANLLQKLGSSFIILFFVSCSKKAPEEVNYAWEEDSESRLEEVENSKTALKKADNSEPKSEETEGSKPRKADSVNSPRATVLVNFGTNPLNTATAADYAIADPAVDLTSTVNILNSDRINVVGSKITIDVVGVDRIFDATRGPNFKKPIIDSYSAQRNITSSTIVIKGLEELSDGTDFTVIVYGVGDTPRQDGYISITYNEINTATGDDTAPTPTIGSFTEADGTAPAFASFTLTKVSGKNSFEINNTAPAAEDWRAINGFSITGTVKEP